MNKIKKHIWKIVASFIILGLFFIFLGFFMGANSGIYLDKTGLHLLNDIEYRATELDLEAFINLNIYVTSIDIEFIPSDNYGIDLCYYEDQSAIDWSLKDGTLEIKNAEQSKIKFFISNFSFLTRGFKNSYLKIYYPSDITLENVIIQTNSGDIRIDNLVAENMKLENLSGNLSINNSTVDTMNIHLKSGNFFGNTIVTNQAILNNNYGKILLKNISAQRLSLHTELEEISLADAILKDLTMQSEYGNITTKNLVSEKTDISTNSGNIKMDGEFKKDTSLLSKYGTIALTTSKEASYYSCDFSSEYGDIKIDNHLQEDASSYFTTTGTNPMKITTNSGNISVNFNP